MQKKARQEINEKIIDFENLTMEELNNLTYTEAFIKESMRLFTPAPQTFRLTTKECSVGNYTLPKGTGVLIPAFFINECTDFERGKEFIPERWLNGEKPCNSNVLLLPSFICFPVIFSKCQFSRITHYIYQYVNQRIIYKGVFKTLLKGA